MPRVAGKCGQVQRSTVNPRDYNMNKGRSVDALPYGGGPGMVMEAEQLAAAISDAKAALGSARVVYLSPQGSRFDQQWAQRLSDEPNLVLLLGRYEGREERSLHQEVDCEEVWDGLGSRWEGVRGG